MVPVINDPTIVQQIYRAISNLPTNEDTSQLIREIVELVRRYLSVDLKEYPPCQFFSYRVRKLTTSLECAKQSGVCSIAQRVQKAIHRLEIVQNPSLVFHLFRQDFREDENVNFTAAFKRQNLEELYGFCGDLTQLERGQVILLFEWALARWEIGILNAILEVYPLDEAQLDTMIKKAFRRCEFERIAIFVMLLHYERLSEGSKQMIQKWLDRYTGLLTLEEVPTMHGYSSIPYGGNDEKFDVRSLHIRLSKAIEESDVASIQRLLANSRFKELTKDAILNLIHQAIRFPEALNVLLLNANIILSRKELIEFLFKALEAQEWQSFTYLFECARHYHIELDDLMGLIVKAQSTAPEAVLVSLQLQIQDFT